MKAISLFFFAFDKFQNESNSFPNSSPFQSSSTISLLSQHYTFNSNTKLGNNHNIEFANIFDPKTFLLFARCNFPKKYTYSVLLRRTSHGTCSVLTVFEAMITPLPDPELQLQLFRKHSAISTLSIGTSFVGYFSLLWAPFVLNRPPYFAPFLLTPLYI